MSHIRTLFELCSFLEQAHSKKVLHGMSSINISEFVFRIG